MRHLATQTSCAEVGNEGLERKKTDVNLLFSPGNVMKKHTLKALGCTDQFNNMAHHGLSTTKDFNILTFPNVFQFETI